MGSAPWFSQLPVVELQRLLWLYNPIPILEGRLCQDCRECRSVCPCILGSPYGWHGQVSAAVSVWGKRSCEVLPPCQVMSKILLRQRRWKVSTLLILVGVEGPGLATSWCIVVLMVNTVLSQTLSPRRARAIAALPIRLFTVRVYEEAAAGNGGAYDCR